MFNTSGVDFHVHVSVPARDASGVNDLKALRALHGVRADASAMIWISATPWRRSEDMAKPGGLKDL